MKGILCFFLILIAKCATSTSQQCSASSVGKRFMFGIIGFGSIYKSLYLRLHITPTEQVHAHVQITAPFSNLDKVINVSNFTIFVVNATQIQFEEGKQFKGIEVISDVNVSVRILAGYSDFYEGFLALPLTALGTHYVALSYKPYSSDNSEILVVGIESETSVSISTMLNGYQGSNVTFQLQKFESYQFKANRDISGSVVVSSKPVAVISGSAYAEVPVGIGSIQYLTEQMVPTKYWTTKFIVPPIYPRLYFILRFFAIHDNTEIQYHNNTKHYAVYLSKGSMEEILFATDSVVVIANKPISVMQYGHDGDNMAGDPYMSTAQGILQYQNSYKFVSQNVYTSGDTLAITINKNNVSGLILNGHSMSYFNNAKRVNVSSPMDQYVTIFVNITYNTYYHLYHSGGLKFGAVIYGRPDTAIAYGYPLQLSLIANDCTGQNPSMSTVSTAQPNYSTQTVQTAGNGKWCFQCDGMAHLKYCDKVTKCPDEVEVCYVQSYTRSFDVRLYRSGCVHPKQCNVSDGNGGCTKCCDGNFCNTIGCGDDGFPAPGHRGPICFDCTHLGDSETCNTVQLCRSNQVCMIEKYEWGDSDSHYMRACADSQTCSKKRSTNELSARHAPVCSHCCHSDFCNDNCTSIHVSEIIG
ncbi:uncharacterized protein LOC132739566 isoform X1 [Ruditapes philippinarum]|uniref:uncharacterized protein LOC132739566 isoform X1 n=1 Tax=Ruditapes philippinarum TaxID=129788 RepID=UPI00295B729C|nr:uncharacterized protein LOC132739566 isoform X1 [Ruditapes philippinarum]